jgi:O-antigen ligase
MLLSSKLILVLSILYLVYYLLKSIFSFRSKWVASIAVVCLLLASVLVLYTNNPIKQRFNDLSNGNATLFQQERFSEDVYFNGLQFRLLAWRFTYEILNRENAWLLGVSPGDAQYELNKRYTETNIYQGDGIKDNKGYTAFNTHNTFLQTTLESGLIGFAVLLAIIISFLVQCFQRRKRSTLLFFTAMLAFCFTDALLSGQYAMHLFIFLPLLSLYAAQPKNDIA